MPRVVGGKAVVESLKNEGAGVVFAVPGVQVMHIFDALYDEPDIQLITVRHEQSTVYMADGYARVTGKPGVASPHAERSPARWRFSTTATLSRLSQSRSRGLPV
jgi:thiamine pyrophosphate-dependent acetolactate synthase large subunit-like protein